MESIQGLDLLPRPIQHTLVNGVRYAVINELGQHQAVLAVVKHLESIGRKWEAVTNVWIPSKHRIDVSRELRSLVLIDRMCDVGGRALDLYSAAHTTLRLVPW